RVVVLSSSTGKLDLVEVMSTLAELEINELFVEAGRTLNGALIESRLVDEIIIYCAPIVLGNHAQSMLNLPELASLSQKWQLEIKEIGKVGSDIKITAKLI
ncbi:MAG TPA: dihydrofolate reductase family protein, partial [Nitrosomonas sp.]|nr:dihydrofolate reductase family protein [Nitrosomonas sp.]